MRKADIGKQLLFTLGLHIQRGALTNFQDFSRPTPPPDLIWTPCFLRNCPLLLKKSYYPRVSTGFVPLFIEKAAKILIRSHCFVVVGYSPLRELL